MALRLPLTLQESISRAMNKYVMEFIGTFFLVLTIGMSVVAGGSGVIPPLAIGSVLMVMIFAGGHISGGHYNPAVTLGVWMRGRTETKDVVPYMIFQTAGALIAATVVKYLDPTAVVHPHVLAVFPALLAEFLFTFALVFVVINTATAKGTSGNSFYGLAIGFTVLAGAFAMGSVTPGAFNPAVAVGVSVMGMVAWSQLWVFFVANFLGGAAAALTFKFLCPTDK
jgi:aquaporin Z